jgi:hypothetical protein
MKIFLLLLVSMSCALQFVNAQNGLDFKPLRYEEEYYKASNDTSLTFLDKIKYIPLSKNQELYTSLGGEIRVQYQYFNNEQWGDAPDDDNGFLLTRGLLHLDTKYKERVRLFFQLQSSTSISRIDPSPIDKNELDIHQLFIDYGFSLNGAEIILRAGRQELLYGSQRLVSVREGPNSRQSFDALKLIWRTENSKTDLFYSQFVSNVLGSFNDRIDSGTKLYGAYHVVNNVPVLDNIDIYYFGLNKKSASYDAVSGEERRHSIGTRVWGNVESWNYDFEAVYQFGDVEFKSIDAWTVSVNTNYQFNNLRFKPRLGLKTEVISGDKSPHDTKLQTFNALFPRGAYFGLGAFIGPSNLYDIHPFIELEFNDRMIVGLDHDLFWRFSKSDGIYQPNTSLLYPSANSSNSFMGSQWGAFMDYDFRKRFTVKVESTYFNTGPYLKDASAGEDIFFIATTLFCRF